MSILGKLRTLGLLHFAETSFNRFIPSWIFRFVIGDLYELDIATLMELNQTLDNDTFDITVVDRGDSGRWETLRNVTWNCVDPSATKNHWGYQIRFNHAADKILGGVWGGGERFPESDLGFEVQLKDRQAWIYCAFVDSSARGQGVYKRLLAFASSHLHGQGFEEVFVVVQPWNRASTYIHKKYSLGKKGRITAIRLLSASFIFCHGRPQGDRICTTSIDKKPVRITIQ